jgi:hypothetical protein
MHELFTAMITVVNSTASVTIFKICEKRTTNHLSAGFSTTPRYARDGRDERDDRKRQRRSSQRLRDTQGF